MELKPIEAILIGAGLRGADAYAPYALQHPDQIRFVAVAEPDPERRERFALEHKIAPENQFESWEPLLERPQMGEAALVCTQDWQHTAPALAGMRQGYHVLLEKPMATRAEECRQLVRTSEETGRQLHICHVLRYTRHFIKMREILQSGVLGEIIDVDHRENVSWWHMAHSFVRGNWRNSHESSPMILAKCCHDLDILPWVLDQHCVTLTSHGELTHYRPDKAPEGAPQRCTDGCPAAQTCPYYAPLIYLEMTPFWRSFADTAHGLERWAAQMRIGSPGFLRLASRVYAPLKQVVDYRGWPLTALTNDPTPENIHRALENGPYGRCVYHCDNDVVDHQVVAMQFSAGATVTLTMHGHSHMEHRSTRIEGSRGRMLAMFGSGGSWIMVEDHRSDHREEYDTSATTASGHGGGDEGIMAAFVESVRSDGSQARTTARQALESHLLAFAAERSRLESRFISASDLAEV